jgi:hypothetical protein
MIILGIEFLALIVICYMFFVYATKGQVSESKRKPIPIRVVGVAIFMLLAMILFASWYVRLGLA